MDRHLVSCHGSSRSRLLLLHRLDLGLQGIAFRFNSPDQTCAERHAASQVSKLGTKGIALVRYSV